MTEHQSVPDPSPPLLTLGDLVRETGIPPHRVKYALSAFNIEPVQRAGIVRLFSRDQLPHIRSCLRRIAGGGRLAVPEPPSINPLPNRWTLPLDPAAGKVLGAVPRKGAM